MTEVECATVLDTLLIVRGLLWIGVALLSIWAVVEIGGYLGREPEKKE